jgi:murein DD-endopeptidase MepM/ murein hydrolase activator NlpD
MNRLLFAAFLVFCAHPLRGAELTAEQDNPSGIRIVREEAGTSVTLRIESKYTSEFTVTLEATLDNMKSSRPVPFTVDSAGRRSFVLVRFDRIDPNRRWRYLYQPYWTYGGRRSTTTNDADYAMPFGPGRYVVMQGPRGTFSHFAGSGSENAVDWTCPVGTIVCAARDGRVVAVKQDSTVGGNDRKWRPFANYVVIKHADGTFADYVHLQPDSVMVNIGEEVTTGQPIARSGKTGFTSAPHLHFSVFQNVDGQTKLTLPFRLKTDRGTFTEFVRGQVY